MPEHRHSRSGSVNIPGGSRQAGGTAAPRFDGPRSPPNTSHVPCKFFKAGACQAGRACPFNHDLNQSSETICKYFAKGNCKFGPKCANIHMLPDGRRITYGKNGPQIVGTAANGNSASGPTNANEGYTSNPSALPIPHDQMEEYQGQPYAFDERPGLDSGFPDADGTYSRTTSNYGSPRDTEITRMAFGLSSANGRGLSVLDAPLPASFDSNGISNVARYPAAPWPSSVPSKFGFDSPMASLGNAKAARTSDTLKSLHNSAWGSSEYLGASLAGSPPSAQPSTDTEYFGKRAMHSSRYLKPRLMSSSVPKTNWLDRDWEPDSESALADFDDTEGAENYVPENLQDLLTPAEKARRGSMRGENDLSIEGVTKYGSPIGATSPSRWSQMFQRQKDEEAAAAATRVASSPFGHVGSPLRTSTLAQEMGGLSGPNGSTTSPKIRASGPEPMSMLSRQFQQSHLDDHAAAAGGSSPHLHPSSAAQKIPTNNMNKSRGMERHISSGSVGSRTGRLTTPIDEEDTEDPDFVFEMEGEDEAAAARSKKRVSGGLSMNPWGNYASAVAGKPASGSGKQA